MGYYISFNWKMIMKYEKVQVERRIDGSHCRLSWQDLKNSVRIELKKGHIGETLYGVQVGGDFRIWVSHDCFDNFTI